MRTESTAKIVAYCGMLTALAMIFSYVESLIPISFGVPGIKLGLANLIVLSALWYLKPGEVLMISTARILLLGFLFGSGMSILYSLAGGLLSFVVMVSLKRTGGFSETGISTAGAVSHNIGQILVAAAVLRSAKLFYYLPVLILSGVITGILIGILAGRVQAILSGTAFAGISEKQKKLSDGNREERKKR
ncbi:MAG: Gx transporter family protein [Lachnospiraceae bacterium]|nr:Gx transporter family protein [Lachnospiraceae bacterium]